MRAPVRARLSAIAQTALTRPRYGPRQRSNIGGFSSIWDDGRAVFTSCRAKVGDCVARSAPAAQLERPGRRRSRRGGRSRTSVQRRGAASAAERSALRRREERKTGLVPAHRIAVDDRSRESVVTSRWRARAASAKCGSRCNEPARLHRSSPMRQFYCPAALRQRARRSRSSARRRRGAPRGSVSAKRRPAISASSPATARSTSHAVRRRSRSRAPRSASARFVGARAVSLTHIAKVVVWHENCTGRV